MQPTAAPTTSDERLLAALSHFFGLFVALIIWATQKDKSPFVRFQALQAMAFDLAVLVVSMVFGFCMGLCIPLTMFGGMALAALAGSSSEDFSPLFILPTLIPFCLWLPILALVVGIFLARLIAAISVFQGRHFHYPWLGKQVEKYLGGNAAPPTAPVAP